MPVTWYWKSHIGDVIYRDHKTNSQWKLGMYNGNALFSFIYCFKEKDENSGKMKEYYNFFTFIDDAKHLKRFFAQAQMRLETMPIGKHSVIKVRLYLSKGKHKYLNKEIFEISKIFVQNGYRVELILRNY